MLTKKQHTLLSYIKDYINQNGFSPTFEEMKEKMEVKSKASISDMLKELEKKDYIATLPLQKRSIIVRHPYELQIGEGAGDNLVPVYDGSLDCLKAHYPAEVYVLLDENKKYFGLVNHGFENVELKIEKADFLIFEKVNKGCENDVFLFYGHDKKIQLEKFAKNDIRKVLGILKFKMEKYD